MIVRLAGEQDSPGFLDLAAQVEHWFGPMVEDPGFRAAVDKHIRRSMALVAVSSGPGLLGGLLFGAKAPTYHLHFTFTGLSSRSGNAARASAVR